MTDSDDDAGAQLQADLTTDVRTIFNVSSSRPILKHLNPDSSWLLSLPYPAAVAPPQGRFRYNILIDPWFRGEQHDYAPWFSTQWHATPSCVQTVGELDEFLCHAEISFLQSTSTTKRKFHPKVPKTFIDLVICSHEFEDHTHEPTLREVDPTVPVLAARKSAPFIRSWKHFKTVSEIPLFHSDLDWRTLAIPPLPSFIGIARMETEFFVQLHTALLIMIGDSKNEMAEVIVYTPHGAEARHFRALSTAKPSLQTLALIHGVTAVSLAGTRLNLGAENARKAQQVLAAKYWVPTHDEVKIAKGVIAYLLRWYPPSRPKSGGDKARVEDAFVNLESGQCLVLD